MNNNIIKLPLWETISHSFLYIIKNIKTICQICSVFLILWLINIFSGHPLLCNASKENCMTQWLPLSFAIIQYLACAVITVETIRSIVFKQNHKWFHLYLGKHHIRYIAYNVAIALMVIIPSALILMIVKSTDARNLSDFTIALLGAAFISTLIGLSIFCCRLYLVYGGAALNDRNMTFAKSYMLTKGNMLKICIGQLILTLPTILMVYIASSIYFAFTPNAYNQSLYSLWIILCYFLEATIKGSYYCHLYQFFEYMSKK